MESDRDVAVTLPPPPPLQRINGEDKGTWTYEVIPYRADTDPMGDVFLIGLWQRLKSEGLFEVLYHDSPGMNFVQFIQSLIQPNQVVLMIIRKMGEKAEHVGIFVLTQVMDTPKLKRAVGGYVFFKDYWNHKDSDEGMAAAFNYMFNVMELDIMGGTTPKRNRASTLFVTRMGMKHVGDLPKFLLHKGEPSDGSVFYITKEMWRERWDS